MYLHKRKKSKVNSCHFLRISVDYAQAWECCKYLLSWLPCILLAVGSFLFSCLPHQWSIVNHQICSTVATGLLLRPKSLPGSIGDNKLQTSFFSFFFSLEKPSLAFEHFHALLAFMAFHITAPMKFAAASVSPYDFMSVVSATAAQ